MWLANLRCFLNVVQILYNADLSADLNAHRNSMSIR